MNENPVSSEPVRAEDLVRRITETRAGSSANAVLGLWAFWFALLATLGLLTGAPWLMVVSGMAAWTAHAVGKRAEAAVAATMVQDLGIDSLGTLMELLEWPVPRVRAVTRWKIASLLRMLRADTPITLEKVQLARLYDALTPMTALQYPWFVESVLDALPILADGQAAESLKPLMRMRAWTRSLRRIRDHARSVLPLVERRIFALRETGAETGPADARVAAGGEPSRWKTSSEEFGDRPQMRFGFLLAAWVLIVPACLMQALELARRNEWLPATLFGGLGIAATQLYRLTMLSRHKRKARELMNEDRVEAIGRLAEAAVWPDPRIRAAAMSALTRLLPRLQASDSRLLTSAQRGCLYTFLTPAQARTHPEFVVGLLKALEQVGDMAAVPYVRALARMPAASARMSAIREAALQCLPVLLERAQLHTDHQTLLRPAEAPGTPEATLVRPAMPGSPSEDIGLLVRPAEAKTTDNSQPE